MISKLEDFKVYNLAMDLGEEVWSIVARWKYFEKDTLGKQVVKAADSIGANLSEGFGRYHFKETINFAYFARGSLFETKSWLVKAKTRGLIKQEQFNSLEKSTDVIGKMLNSYITKIRGLN